MLFKVTASPLLIGAVPAVTDGPAAVPTGAVGSGMYVPPPAEAVREVAEVTVGSADETALEALASLLPLLPPLPRILFPLPLIETPVAR